MSETFRSLRVRNYRLFWYGQLVSLVGTWMQRIAQDWLVSELSHGDGTIIGATIAIQFLPIGLFGMYGGVIADRYPKRQILIGTQVSLGLFALALGILDITGAVTVWQVWVLSFLVGLASMVDTPTRQAFVSEMVGPKDIQNAVSLNSSAFNGARVAGPAVAGLLIHATGTGWVFLINAASYLAVLYGLARMRDDELFKSKRVARKPGQLREGLNYVRRRPDLLWPIVLVFILATLGLNFQLLLVLMSAHVFHSGSLGFGVMSAAFAVGSLIGALMSAARGAPRLRTLLLAGCAFGVLEMVTGFMPTYPLFLLLLVLTGWATLTFTTTANSSCQVRSAPQMRGRVMALYVMVFLGGTPIGAPIVGWLANEYGPRAGLYLGGAASLLGAIGCGAMLLRARHLRLVPHVRPRPHVHVRATQEPAPAFDDALSA